MRTIPLYIFDLDGTLALNDHRNHILANRTMNSRDRWAAYFAACGEDKLNKPVADLLAALALKGNVRVWSGRAATVRTITEVWLDRHGIKPDELRMRAENDFTPDEVLKMRWLAEMEPEDRQRLVCVFDDRQKVVDAWRAAGVVCCQVAPGDF